MKKSSLLIPYIIVALSSSAIPFRNIGGRRSGTPYKICPECGTHHKHHNDYCSGDCARIFQARQKQINKDALKMKKERKAKQEREAARNEH